MGSWVKDNVPITVAEIRKGKPFRQVLEDLAGLMQDGDTIVAHNASFDLNTAIGRTADKLGIKTWALQKILQAPRFCTLRCAYTKALLTFHVETAARATLSALPTNGGPVHQMIPSDPMRAF